MDWWKKESIEKQGRIAVGMRPGFKGAANAFKGGSTPSPAAKDKESENTNSGGGK